jgi:hypothetical protein
MNTSTMPTKHVASVVRKILMAVAVALAVGSILAGPALAAEHRRGERREHEWRWPRNYRPYGYGYGYAAPPVVYAPPPVVYAPPPPVVYAPPPPPPGISFVFPIRIR